MPMKQEDLVNKFPYREGRAHTLFTPDNLWKIVDFFGNNLVSSPKRWVIVAYCLEQILPKLKQEYDRAIKENDSETILKINNNIKEVFKKYDKTKTVKHVQGKN